MINEQYNNEIRELIDIYGVKHISAIILYNGKSHKDYSYLRTYVFENTKFMDNTGFKYTFINRIYNVLNDIIAFPKCKHELCDKILLHPKFFKGFTKGYQLHCCNSCGQKDVDTIHKKEQTSLLHCGSKYFLQSEIGQASIRQFYQENFGCDNAFQVEEYKDKARQTLLRNIGADHPMHSNEIVQQKIILPTIIKMYHRLMETSTIIEPLFDIAYLVEHRYDKLNWKCHKCNNVFLEHIDNSYWKNHVLNTDHTLVRCPYCYPKCSGWSIGELDVMKFIASIYDGKICWQQKENRQIISPYELDIWLPNINLAIEYNGTWFHSIEYNSANINGCYNKTVMCEKQGITLIHIYEDEWNFKQKQIKKFLKTLITQDTLFNTEDTMLILNRDKFPLTLTPTNYILDRILSPQCVLRSTNSKNDKYHVYDSGKLIYRKI